MKLRYYLIKVHTKVHDCLQELADDHPQSRMLEPQILESQHDEPPKPKKLLGVRHLQFVLLFFTFVIFSAISNSITVAIISMTEETPPDPSIPTYPEWNNVDTILSAAIWCLTCQIAVGGVVEYFGPKWFLVSAMILYSVCSIAVPPMAQALGSTGVIICQVCMGLCQCILYPSVHNLLSRWTPLYERSRVVTFVYGGEVLSVAISRSVTGVICGSEFGWPMVYYSYGGIGFGFAIIFALFTENSPARHKWITEQERLYIESSNSVDVKKKIPTPWLSMASSVPVWSLIIASIGQWYGTMLLLTEIPSYMANIMNYDISSNSLLSSLPYLIQFLLSITASPVADKIVEKQIVSITLTRKIFNSLGSVIPAAALIALAFLQTFNNVLVTLLFIIAVSSTALGWSGFFLNIIDLAPNHAGTLAGIVNTAGAIFSILSPLSVQFFGTDKKDPILWKNVFLLAAGAFLGCNAFYCVFGTAKVQSWNDAATEETFESRRGNNRIYTRKS